jgi:flagellar basal body-associated protein FliL
MIVAIFILFALALGGIAFVFTAGDEKTQKRVAAVAKAAPNIRGRSAASQDPNQKRKNVAALLKDVE